VGSTPIDFAYRIHTDIGNRCVGAKVNGKIVPLSHKLETGDIVEILTSKQSAGPSLDWLDIVKTASARSKIRSWFKKLLREEDIERGEAALERELAKQGLALSAIDDTDVMKNVLERLNYPDTENLYAAIAYGGISPIHVASRLREETQKLMPELLPQKEEPQKVVQRKPRGPEEAVAIKGMSDILVRLAHCCNPVPGDPIIGYVTRGRGVSVHRMDCPSLMSFADKERFIEASWVEPQTASSQASYPVEVWIEAVDRPGLFAEVTGAISGIGANILSAAAKRQPDGSATITSVFETHNLKELQETLNRIRQIKGITSVNRVLGRAR
jgi:GTP pyrophosphokinase